MGKGTKIVMPSKALTLWAFQHLKSQKKLASLKLQCLFTNQMMMK